MPLVVNLADVSDSDLPLVGGKASKLGEVVRQGLPVPPGIIVTTEAYQTFVDQTPVKAELAAALATIEPSRPETIEAASRRIRESFESTPFPPELRTAIVASFERFTADEGVRFVAVRSSAGPGVARCAADQPRSFSAALTGEAERCAACPSDWNARNVRRCALVPFGNCAIVYSSPVRIVAVAS